MVSFCDIHESSTQVCVASFVECLSRGRQQLGHAHHVVAEHAQLHEPGHFGASTQFGPAQQSILLAPTEAFLDAFAKTLTDPVASVPRGARIDRGAAVLDTGGERIPGLFAAGELVGGIFYGNYLGGAGLMSGAVFGRQAGKSAAEFASARATPV